MINDLQVALVGTGTGQMRRTYAVAFKKAAGPEGQPIFDLDGVVTWKKRHPRWSLTRPLPQDTLGDPLAAIAGKYGGRG